MITVAHVAALLTAAAGLVVATMALVRTRRISLSLALLLDFFTAASLLRLVGPLTWPVLGTAALTIVIRQLASRGLVAAERSDQIWPQRRQWADRNRLTTRIAAWPPPRARSTRPRRVPARRLQVPRNPGPCDPSAQ
jgi:hypothetical protein